MTGVPNSYTHRGLIPRCLGGIFQEIANHPEKAVTVRLSYTEIYNELMCAAPHSPQRLKKEVEGLFRACKCVVRSKCR